MNLLTLLAAVASIVCFFLARTDWGFGFAMVAWTLSALKLGPDLVWNRK